MTDHERAGDRSGFALLGVLWLVVLVTIVGLDFSLRARAITQRVASAADQSMARAAAEGCLVHAEAQLRLRLERAIGASTGSLEALDPWRQPGAIANDTVDIGDARCHVTFEDAGERLHLNRAGEDELRELMVRLRLDTGDADRLAQAILDWRDPDDLRRGRGAEREEYMQAESPVLPRNAAFTSVDEVRLVLGMTERVYARVRPALNTLGSGRVNLSAAPPEGIAALPGMSESLLVLILRARAEQGVVPDLLTLSNELDEPAREQLRGNLVGLVSRLTNTTQEIIVRSRGWTPGGALSVTATALAVRGAGTSVFLTERRLR
jgi:general secretion pathway protein K